MVTLLRSGRATQADPVQDLIVFPLPVSIHRSPAAMAVGVPDCAKMVDLLPTAVVRPEMALLLAVMLVLAVDRPEVSVPTEELRLVIEALWEAMVVPWEATVAFSELMAVEFPAILLFAVASPADSDVIEFAFDVTWLCRSASRLTLAELLVSTRAERLVC